MCRLQASTCDQHLNVQSATFYGNRPFFHFQLLCVRLPCILLAFSTISSISVFYWSQRSPLLATSTNLWHGSNSISRTPTGKPFDVVHSGGIGLFHGRAANISNLAVSWHGIAYETMHSDIVEDLLWSPGEPQQLAIMERIPRVLDEVKFFKKYAHHVATSDHVGDVLKRIYMVPEVQVHVILNGVDEEIYKLDVERGREFRRKLGITEDAALVIGMAGRLVKDKGHPTMFEALKQLFNEDESFHMGIYVLVAGDGPWGVVIDTKSSDITFSSLVHWHNWLHHHRSRDLVTLSFPQSGHSKMLSTQSGKKGVRFSRRKKGEIARQRAMELFTATNMAAAYERLFLCISSKTDGGNDLDDFCIYPLPMDQKPLLPSKG